MTAKRRHRAIAKARKRLFIHYKKSYPREFRNDMDRIRAFAEATDKIVRRIIEEQQHDRKTKIQSRG